MRIAIEVAAMMVEVTGWELDQGVLSDAIGTETVTGTNIGDETVQ